MNTLTPSEQEIVEKAAKLVCSCESDYCAERTHFNDAIQWTISNILPGRSIGFVEWVSWNYEQSAGGDGKWLARKENPIQFYTTEQLYDKYQEHLKQQEPGR